jgi:hypothetical protein
LPTDFEQSQNKIVLDKADGRIKNAIKLGSCPSLELNIYEFKHNSSYDPRVTLSRESFNIIKNDIEPNALAIFFNEDTAQWRLSLITSDYSLAKKKGRVKQEFSNPRRFSYLLGENCKLHTPESMLYKDYRVKSHDDLVSRFAIEVVTKQFYKDLFTWYDTWAVQLVNFPTGTGSRAARSKKPDIEKNRQHLIRLITRLIFVWFLRQKEKLVPQWIFDEKEIAKVLHNFNSKSEKQGNYYNGVIQNLFFATLNKPIGEREFANQDDADRKDDYGIKTKYRDFNDKSLFSNDYAPATNPRKFIDLFNAIPFLNGGLFECLDNFDTKEYEDGFSREEKRAAFVPNCLFWGNSEHEGLIPLLNRYNFTIEENTPQDIDIALDPELLGKVFENLLGTYNEETRSTARNESGSFYTPREIVDYMVDTSLKEYFKGKLDSEKNNINEKLDKLFLYHESGHDFDPDQVTLLMAAINDCKILDPACGSGAFPMGILNKLAFIMQKLDPKNEIWRAIQIKKATEDTAKAFSIEDKEKRNNRLNEIKEVFDISTGEFSNYVRKLFLIENCIYGVDIQPIAIQISKLRFFISLIADQKTGGTIDNNYNVLPLPNLETKFVAANTLIGIKRGQGSLIDPNIEQKQEELLIIRHNHFSAREAKEKIALRKKDGILCRELAELLKKGDVFSSDDVDKLLSWNPYNQTKPAEFFDPMWMFSLKKENTSFSLAGCFDIIIGNPPYLKEGRVLKDVFLGIKKTTYYQGKMDLWYAFACFAIDFLSEKGLLCFIATNNWISNAGSSILRNKVISDTKILQLIDFGNFMIFEKASIQTMIMLFTKDNKSDNYPFDYRKLHGDTVLSDALDLIGKKENNKSEYLNPHILRNYFMDRYLTFGSSSSDNIFNKITQNVFFLNDYEVANGIHPHYDFVNNKLSNKYGLKKGEGIFGLSNQEKHNLKLSGKELELIKPYYTTVQIKRYYSIPENDLWIIYTNSSFKDPKSMDKYPRIKKHLDKYKDIITSDNKPYGLHRSREERFFKGEKIIAQRKCVNQPIFSFSDFDCYVSATFYLIKTNRINMRCLLGILNSKLIAYWLKHKGKMQGENYQLDKEPLKDIPLPIINSNRMSKSIEKLINNIMTVKSKNINADISVPERKIDCLVYHLYNLTYEEVMIIEPNFTLSKLEYEKMK